jgi:hypothetical protein
MQMIDITAIVAGAIRLILLWANTRLAFSIAFRSFWLTARISAAVVASACASPAGSAYTSIVASSAILPGIVATCSASWPNEKDFGCGRHDRCSSGTRNNTRSVAFASASSSASSELMVFMICAPWLLQRA